ncbi:MAG: hypothetical protein L0Y67_01670 [Gammaproteobacteria bacterium]|nr:hypothetical protein [Gammaproteobacteria bacterium]
MMAAQLNYKEKLMPAQLKLAPIIIIIFSLLLDGCATSRGIVLLNVPIAGTQAQSNGKEIYINSVRDERAFETRPRSPNIPSLDPDEAQGDNVKLRAIARKRNSFGKGLGDILLKEDQTVESVIHDSLRQALTENGFKVIDRKEDVTDQTDILDAKIDKFWSWMNPGFWAITLSTEISTRINLKQVGHTDKNVISANTSRHVQTIVEGNWLAVMQSALRAYILDAKSKLH